MDDIIKTLKDNLKIMIEKEVGFDNDEITIKLLFGDEVISEDSVYIDNGTNDWEN